MVRREYAFWWTDIDYYVRHLKELIVEKDLIMRWLILLKKN